jgi:hypothetical protein
MLMRERNRENLSTSAANKRPSGILGRKEANFFSAGEGNKQGAEQR